MIRCRRIIFKCTAVIVLMVLAGCQGSYNRKAGEESGGKKEAIEHDPLGLAADFVVISGQTKETSTADSTAGRTGGSAVKAQPEKTVAVAGRGESYRIQLFTTKTYQPAMAELDIAREIFDQKVWLDYEVPYYKIRVGDFADREAAERYVPAAVEAGYTNAWVVKVNADARRLEGMYDDAEIMPFLDSLNETDENDTENANDTTRYPQDQIDNTGD